MLTPVGAHLSGTVVVKRDHAQTRPYRSIRTTHRSMRSGRPCARPTRTLPRALSGYRLKLSVTASGDYNHQNATSLFPLAGALITSQFAQNFYSRTVGATGTYTLKQTQGRFNVGEVTRTDVAQTELRLAAGRSQLLGAQSQYVTSRAQYRRVIGVDG